LGKKRNYTVLATLRSSLDFENELFSVSRNHEIDLGISAVGTLRNPPAVLPKSIAYKALELGLVVFR
jgi:hypothetical protein